MSSENSNDATQQEADFRRAYYINMSVEPKYSYLVKPQRPVDLIKVTATVDGKHTELESDSEEVSYLQPKPPHKEDKAIAAVVFDIDPLLSPADADIMRRMLVSTLHAFANNPKVAPTPAPGVSHAINLTDPHPIKQNAYRQSPAKQATVEATVTELLARDLIQPSNSAWSSPIVLVPKPNGDWRMCIDYRKVNYHTKKDAYPTPDIRDCLNLCKNADFLTLVDIKDAYHHILMDPGSIQTTAFITPRGLFEWKRMPFGLCNAPATFQRYVDNCLRGLLGKTCAAFFDDCAVYTTGTIEQHTADVKEVLERLATAGLEANMKKCRFAYKEMLFIGHIVSKGTIKPDPAKLRAVKEFPTPENLSQLRSFLGLANYYHDFIPGFALTCVPLYRLTRKDVPFDWCSLCIIAFDQLKDALLAAPCLYAPNFQLPFILQTDASGIGIAAVLAQVVDEREHPVGFISRQLGKHEKNYSATEWECLAVVWAIGQFEVYLVDAPFTVITDHAALQWLPTKKMGNSRLQRWAMTLAEFSFTVIHRAGKLNGNVDSLSRVPLANSAPLDDSIDPAIAPGEVTPHYVRNITTRHCPFPTLSMPPSNDYYQHTSPFHVRFMSFADRRADRNVRATKLTSSVPAPSFRGAPNREISDQVSEVSIVDLSKLERIIEEQYNDKRIRASIDYKTSRLIPQTYDEAMRKKLISMNYSFALMPQAPPLRPALFYFPSQPRRGLSSLVPIVPRLVVPKSMHNAIIEMFHNYAFGGHFGERRTTRKVMVNYYWDTLLADVIKYVSDCKDCQKEKIQRRRAERPAGLIDSPTYPFELISMDFVGPMNPKSGEFEYILVVCDHFTRFAITVPCTNTSAETVARALVNEVYNRYGSPVRLLSDRGSQFHSQLCRELHSYLRIKQLFTSAHHPQTNGLVERFNATLKDMLYSLKSEFGNNWDDALQSATFAYNTGVHTSTGMTPYYALYGREANTPGDAIALTAAENDYDINIPQEVYNKYQIDNIGRAQDFIRSLMDSKRTAHLADKAKFLRVPTYNVGDLVYARDEKSDTTTGSGRSHVTPFKGPYVILRKCGEYAYELKLNDRTGQKTIANVDRLKPYSKISKSQSLTSEESDTSQRMPHVGAPKIRSELGDVDPNDDLDTSLSDVHDAPSRFDEDNKNDVDVHMTDIDPTALPPPSDDMIDDNIDATSTSLPSSSSSSSASSPIPLPSSSSSSSLGPAAAAKQRHAHQSQPLYSDAFASRLPGNPVHARYSLPATAKELESRRVRIIYAASYVNIHTEKYIKVPRDISSYVPTATYAPLRNSQKIRPFNNVFMLAHR